MLHFLQSFTLLDWLMVAVVGLSVIRAALHGFVREIFWLAGSILGLVLASIFYATPAHALQHITNSLPVAEVISFLLIVFGVMLLAGLLGRMVRSAVRFAGLGLADSLAGAFFGFLRGTLLVTAGMMAVAAFLPASATAKDNFSGSVLAPYFLGAAHAVSSVVPLEMERRVPAGILLLKQQWMPSKKLQ